MAEYSWPAKDKATTIGKRVKRLDGPEKSTGAAKYTYDVNLKPKATEEEIRQGLNGNLCRCGTYANVIHAALMVVKGGSNG